MFAEKGYAAIIRELYGFRRLGIRPALGPVKNFLAVLGNPERAYPCFHVAGTNGKGSTTAMIAATLTEAGYRTGAYYSPHITDFRERFLLDGRFFPKREITSALRWMEKEFLSKPNRPDQFTFFEWSTALAFVLFARAGVDVAVLETGMGGTFDATNVVRPEVSVITNVALEHTDILGRTVNAIAVEKVGIIKNGVPVVCGSSLPSVKKAVRAAAKAKRSKAYFVGDDFRIDARGHFTGAGGEKLRLRPGMEGKFQFSNAALAAQAILLAKHFSVSSQQIESGVANAVLPGRFETVQVKGRTVIFDVAHNPPATRELIRLLWRKGGSFNFVVGILGDKDYREMLKLIAPLADHVYCITPDDVRAIPAERLRRTAAKLGIDAVALTDIGDLPLSRNVPLCVTGSFTTVEAVKKSLRERVGL